MVLHGAAFKMFTTMTTGFGGFLGVQATIIQTLDTGHVSVGNLVWASQDQVKPDTLAICPSHTRMCHNPYFLVLTATWGFLGEERCH